MTTPDRDDDAVPAVPDVERAWADIVARWEGEVPTADDAAPPDTGAPGAAAPTTTAGTGTTGAARSDAPAPWPSGAGSGPRDHPLADGADDADAYVPPEPPPLSRVGWATWLPWAGVLGGPLLLLLSAALRDAVPAAVVALAVCAFTAGSVLLVLRLPTRRDDDGDDGAVV